MFLDWFILFLIFCVDNNNGLILIKKHATQIRAGAGSRVLKQHHTMQVSSAIDCAAVLCSPLSQCLLIGYHPNNQTCFTLTQKTDNATFGEPNAMNFTSNQMTQIWTIQTFDSQMVAMGGDLGSAIEFGNVYSSLPVNISCPRTEKVHLCNGTILTRFNVSDNYVICKIELNFVEGYVAATSLGWKSQLIYTYKNNSWVANGTYLGTCTILGQATTFEFNPIYNTFPDNTSCPRNEYIHLINGTILTKYDVSINYVVTKIQIDTCCGYKALTSSGWITNQTYTYQNSEWKSNSTFLGSCNSVNSMSKCFDGQGCMRFEKLGSGFNYANYAMNEDPTCSIKVSQLRSNGLLTNLKTVTRADLGSAIDFTFVIVMRKDIKVDKKDRTWRALDPFTGMIVPGDQVTGFGLSEGGDKYLAVVKKDGKLRNGKITDTFKKVLCFNTGTNLNEIKTCTDCNYMQTESVCASHGLVLARPQPGNLFPDIKAYALSMDQDDAWAGVVVNLAHLWKHADGKEITASFPSSIYYALMQPVDHLKSNSEIVTCLTGTVSVTGTTFAATPCSSITGLHRYCEFGFQEGSLASIDSVYTLLPALASCPRTELFTLATGQVHSGLAGLNVTSQITKVEFQFSGNTSALTSSGWLSTVSYSYSAPNWVTNASLLGGCSAYSKYDKCYGSNCIRLENIDGGFSIASFKLNVDPTCPIKVTNASLLASLTTAITATFASPPLTFVISISKSVPVNKDVRLVRSLDPFVGLSIPSTDYILTDTSNDKFTFGIKSDGRLKNMRIQDQLDKVMCFGGGVNSIETCSSCSYFQAIDACATLNKTISHPTAINSFAAIKTFATSNVIPDSVHAWIGVVIDLSQLWKNADGSDISTSYSPSMYYALMQATDPNKCDNTVVACLVGTISTSSLPTFTAIDCATMATTHRLCTYTL